MKFQWSEVEREAMLYWWNNRDKGNQIINKLSIKFSWGKELVKNFFQELEKVKQNGKS